MIVAASDRRLAFVATEGTIADAVDETLGSGQASAAVEAGGGQTGASPTQPRQHQHRTAAEGKKK